MDEAGLLAPDEREALGALAYEIHTNKGPQITVLTVPDLQGYPVEEFSIRVAEKWQLGTKKEGNGLLILVSKAERKVRIEVGEGIEGEVTDYEANQYINNVLVPAFKQGQFYEGLRAVMEDIAGTFNLNLEDQSRFVRRAPVRVGGGLDRIFPIIIVVLVLGHIFIRRSRVGRGLFSGLGMAGAGWFFFPGIGLGVVLLFFLGLFLGAAGVNNAMYAASSGRRSPWGGGGFGGGGFGGGGGWGGGGGGFSGGGSSGNW
jgi:uncharacterized protein